MTEYVSFLGVSVLPIQVGATALLALIFGIQAKVKARPYLLALQAAFAAIIIGQFGVTLGEAGVAPVFFFNQFMSVTFGVMFSHFFGAWLLITLVFFVRFRNHNARIFTRNRDQ